MTKAEKNISILKKLGVWEKWRINFDINTYGEEQDETMMSMKAALLLPFKRVVTRAFSWSNTPEGFHFWEQISEYNEDTDIEN
jgi:hypothetical protein